MRQTTESEQIRNEFQQQEHSHTHWALIITIGVVILFGIFWYIQRHRALFHTQPPTQSVTQIQQTPHSSTINVDDLQTAAANLAIPHFSEQL